MLKTLRILFAKKKSLYWGIGAALVLVLVLVVALSSRNGQGSSKDTTVLVKTVRYAETIQATGTLEARPFAGLEWRTGGVVENVNAKVGDKVKKGDVLMSIDAATATVNMASAMADLVTARNELQDLMNSDSDRAQAAIDLEDAKDDYKKAYDYREELNGKIDIVDITYTYKGGQAIPKVHYYKGYADKGTIAEADNSLALAKAKVEDRQRTYDRLRDGPSPDNIAAAQAKVDAAEATVNSASIIAPFDGQVLWVETSPGDVVSTGTLAVNLGDTDHLFVDAQVDESDIAKVTVGNPVNITLDALPGVPFTGAVQAINPVGESTSGLIKYSILIALDRADDNTLMPLGTTANTTIQVQEPKTMLILPLTAVTNDAKGEYVWLIQADGSTKRVDIVTGSMVGDQVILTGDLKEGDRIETVHTSNIQAPGFGAGN